MGRSRRPWDAVDYCLTPLGQELFNSNRKMLHYYAGKVFQYYRSQGVLLTFDECLSACSHGLIRAIHEYDKGRGTKFSTCAYVWMFKHIQKEARRWYSYNKHQKALSQLAIEYELFGKLFGEDHKPFSEFEASSDLQTIMEKIELTDKQKKRLHRLFSGMTLMEISRVENVSFQAIQLSNSRSIQKMRQVIKDLEIE